MNKKVDNKMVKSALIISGIFTLLICIILFMMANEPYLLYDVSKTLKSGDLHPMIFTIEMGVVVLFFILSATLFSIAHYKREIVADEKEDKTSKRTIKKRKHKPRIVKEKDVKVIKAKKRN